MPATLRRLLGIGTNASSLSASSSSESSSGSEELLLIEAVTAAVLTRWERDTTGTGPSRWAFQTEQRVAMASVHNCDCWSSCRKIPSSLMCTTRYSGSTTRGLAGSGASARYCSSESGDRSRKRAGTEFWSGFENSEKIWRTRRVMMGSRARRVSVRRSAMLPTSACVVGR